MCPHARTDERACNYICQIDRVSQATAIYSKPHYGCDLPSISWITFDGAMLLMLKNAIFGKPKQAQLDVVDAYPISRIFKCEEGPHDKNTKHARLNWLITKPRPRSVEPPVSFAEHFSSSSQHNSFALGHHPSIIPSRQNQHHYFPQHPAVFPHPR